VIRIQVDLHPYGRVEGAKRIASMEIENITPDADGPADYRVKWVDGTKIREAFVRRHRRGDGVWSIVARALASVESVESAPEIVLDEEFEVTCEAPKRNALEKVLGPR
jgi:hypothetical protein